MINLLCFVCNVIVLGWMLFTHENLPYWCVCTIVGCAILNSALEIVVELTDA